MRGDPHGTEKINELMMEDMSPSWTTGTISVFRETYSLCPERPMSSKRRAQQHADIFLCLLYLALVGVDGVRREIP
jgi:hypothetical protein